MGGPGSIPGQGTRSHTPHLTLHAAAKEPTDFNYLSCSLLIWCSQISNFFKVILLPRPLDLCEFPPSISLYTPALLLCTCYSLCLEHYNSDLGVARSLLISNITFLESGFFSVVAPSPALPSPCLFLCHHLFCFLQVIIAICKSLVCLVTMSSHKNTNSLKAQTPLSTTTVSLATVLGTQRTVNIVQGRKNIDYLSFYNLGILHAL